MGDLSEMRGFVVVASFIGLLIFLLAFMPVEFAYPTATGRTIEVPSYFDSGQLGSAVLIANCTGLGPSYVSSINVAGYPITVSALFDRKGVLVEHVQEPIEWLTFVDGNGVTVSTYEIVMLPPPLFGTEINYMKPSNMVNTEKLTIKCSHTSMTGYFGWATTYTNGEDAYDHNALWLYLEAGLDRNNTALNGWSLIQSVLFLNIPNVEPIISYIVGIPIWICIAYLSFIMVLRVAGAIFGGGGA
jgi:hypothetical protein